MRMRILSLTINNFRLFKEQTFYLGKYMTIFSGTNAVGKSTLLGILGNSSELKVREGKPIIQNQFRTEFSEIFKMSRVYDKSAPNILTISFSDNSIRTCRITWQKNPKTKKTRPRMIPEYKDANGKKHSAKQKWPTLFLGLSRLFPIGESESEELIHKNIPSQNLQNVIDEYKKILSIPTEIKSIQSVSIPETSRKHAFAIETNEYDYLSNSAGQDNLGQILLAIESFKRLKEKQADRYSGGMLLIDELDATLHPSAQIKLVKYLLKQAKSLDLQVVYTTHSLSILEYASRALTNSSIFPDATENDTNVYYLSKANLTLQVQQNPHFFTIKSLLEEDPLIHGENKVKVYTEDAEARWFLQNLFGTEAKKITSRLNLLDTKIGKNSLLSIIKGDFANFISKIVILDGDVQTDTATKNIIHNLNNARQHILTLPGTFSPEKTIFEFLISNSQEAHEYFLQEDCISHGITIAAIQAQYQSAGNDREKLKKLFGQYKDSFEETHVMKFWGDANQMLLTPFLSELKDAYNTIAKNLGLIPIN